ncbi:MAG: DUF937 domain-containing protein [Bryobacterales bacterium]|jgi:hypothetical protein|nr:DUF937 domain-containing protein [Bryobacterales bacterium]
MNEILNLLMNASGGAATHRVAERFGLSDDQAGNALAQLVPALMAGLQSNTSQQGGMEALLGALSRGSHSEYLERPDLLDREETVTEGNAILSHILGSKDVSRSVASRAAGQTGIGEDILKKMLPIAATMVMGALSRQTAPARAAAPQGAAGLLTQLLDQNRDGSIADDVMGMLGRFLGGR